MTPEGALVGITQARFEPLHNGHIFMVRMAYGLLQAEAQRQGKAYAFHVIVCSHDGEYIDGHLRFAWAKRVFGGYEHITVHHAHNALEHLDGYGNDYAGDGYTKDWSFWGKVATDLCGLGDTVDYFYGSEGYVEPIAKACGAAPVIIDQNRETLTVSGTIMRNAPYLNWDNFPDAVKPFFAKKVCIIGGPYTGKKRLAAALSQHYQTPLVGDVSNSIYDPDVRGCTKEDLVAIAQLHTVRAQALIEQANRVVISDSDTLLSALWYEALFGDTPDTLSQLADEKRFDLYLLVESDGHPFRASNSFPDEPSRNAFTETIRAALDARHWPYVSLSGPLDRQVSKAVPAIDNMAWYAEQDGLLGWYPGLQENIDYCNR